MAEYIKREAILDLLKNKYQDMSAMPASYYKGFQYALKTIEKIKPAADVAPVRHGRWEWRGPCHDNNGKYWATCNACKKRQRLGDYERFCPNCGCKMDLEE